MMLLEEPGRALMVDESKEDMKTPKKKKLSSMERHDTFRA